MAQDVPALSISIPAQSLNQALLELGQQADIQIYYLPETVSGLQAAPVSGRMTPQQAMQSLLKGTGVQASWKGRTVSLSRSGRVDTTQLAPITVTAKTGLATEGSGSYVAMRPTTSASGLELSLRETPQSMTVITHQKIEDKITGLWTSPCVMRRGLLRCKAMAIRVGSIWRVATASPIFSTTASRPRLKAIRATSWLMMIWLCMTGWRSCVVPRVCWKGLAIHRHPLI